MSLFGRTDYSKMGKDAEETAILLHTVITMKKQNAENLQAEINKIHEYKLSSFEGNQLFEKIDALHLEEKKLRKVKRTIKWMEIDKARLAREIKKTSESTDKNNSTDKSKLKAMIDTAHQNALTTRETIEQISTINTSIKRAENFINSREEFTDRHSKSEFNEELASFSDKFQNNFSWLSFVFSAIDGLFSVFRVINGWFLNQDNKAASYIQIGVGATGILLSILNIAVLVLTIVIHALVIASTIALMSAIIAIASPVLAIASAVKGIVNSTLKISLDIRQRYSEKNIKREEKIKELMNNCDTVGKLCELTKNINERNKDNRTLANRTHGLIQGLVALTGIILLLFPPTTLAGVIILGSLAAYSLLDTLSYKGYSLNPIKLAANGINALYKKIAGKPMGLNPFDTLTEVEVYKKYTANGQLKTHTAAVSSTQIASSSSDAAAQQPSPTTQPAANLGATHSTTAEIDIKMANGNTEEATKIAKESTHQSIIKENELVSDDISSSTSSYTIPSGAPSPTTSNREDEPNAGDTTPTATDAALVNAQENTPSKIASDQKDDDDDGEHVKPPH